MMGTRLVCVGLVVASALGGAGCTPETMPGAMAKAEVMDDVLRMNHLQCEGTHNSYHIQSWFPLAEYQYTRDELSEQADSQGVRKFELDIHYNGIRDQVDVFHAVVIDRRSNCDTLSECVINLRKWSDAHPDHHPMFILLEPKVIQPTISSEDFLDLVEEEILSALLPERIITPDEVQGDHETLPRALAEDGWPTLAESRGRFMFILHDTGELRDVYTYGGQSLEGRLMFVESSPGDPFGAFVIQNDPVGGQDAIQAAVEAGYLVRTRVDSGLNEDQARMDAGFESGAHILSTDFPDEVASPNYFVEIPGGTPSRCNPLTAPTDCESRDIEDL